MKSSTEYPTSSLFNLNRSLDGGSDEPEAPSPRRTWILLPLSFVFLLFGVALGFQLAMGVGQRLPAVLRPADPLALNLAVEVSGETLHLSWNRGALAVQQAQHGALHIVDAGIEKTVDLTAEQLQNGSVVYHRGSEEIDFRMEVQVRDRSMLVETYAYRGN